MKVKLGKDTLIGFGSILSLICFLMVTFFKQSFTIIDYAVNSWSSSINSNFFIVPARLISVGFDIAVLFVVTIAVAAVLFILHYRRYSILLLGAMTGDALIVDFCKTLIASTRPINQIIPLTNFSFPSGHVMGVIVFFGIIVFIVWREWESFKVKFAVGTLFIFLVCLVGFDRLYLNVHWLSDVIGAVFLGFFWLTFCIFVFDYLKSKIVIT